jgi:hypothetical protein
MDPLFEKASGLTETIIAGSIEVHRDKGAGLIESIYEWCLQEELELRGLKCVSHSCAQRPPAIISFIIWRPVACNGPMPLPGRNQMPLSLSRQ